MGAALSLLAFSPPARAEEPIVPMASWFAGFGGSFNSIDFDQDLFAAGDGIVYSGDTPVAIGGAGGPAASRESNESTLAPAAQLGYFRHFGASDWLWGAKATYQYTDAASTIRDIDPQTGILETIDGPDTFTGNVVVGSYKTQLNHQFAFMPFIGHSFERSYVYAGAGPALFATRTEVDNVLGFADVNGEHAEPTGTPVDFASSQWVWGAAAQIGLAYYLGRNWFVDFNYTFARSDKFSSDYSSPFADSSAGYDIVGNLYVSPSQRVTNQSITITINRGW